MIEPIMEHLLKGVGFLCCRMLFWPLIVAMRIIVVICFFCNYWRRTGFGQERVDVETDAHAGRQQP